MVYMSLPDKPPCYPYQICHRTYSFLYGTFYPLGTTKEIAYLDRLSFLDLTQVTPLIMSLLLLSLRIYNNSTRIRPQHVQSCTYGSTQEQDTRSHIGSSMWCRPIREQKNGEVLQERQAILLCLHCHLKRLDETLCEGVQCRMIKCCPDMLNAVCLAKRRKFRRRELWSIVQDQLLRNDKC